MRLPQFLRLCTILVLLPVGGTIAQEGHGPPRVTGGAASGAGAAADTAAFARAMDDAMRRMMDDMHRGALGDPDRDFLAMMIPHHQGAVDMARLVLLHGRDPLTRKLAEHVIATQAVEIEAMRGRLEALSSPHLVEYPTVGGTRGLSTTSGAPTR